MGKDDKGKLMASWSELMEGLDDDKKAYCQKHLKEDDELLFEVVDVTDKISILYILRCILYLIIFQGALGPIKRQYVIGAGKLNLYILYMGKFSELPPAKDAKPEHIQIISRDSIKGIDIKRMFWILTNKMSIVTQEEDKVFYMLFGKEKCHIEYLKSISNLK